MTEAEARAIARLRETNQMYAQAHPQLAAADPVGRMVALLGTFGFLQAEGIATLTETNEAFHLQVAELVRSLLEAWFQAAWIVAPDTEEARLQRVIGLKSKGLAQHRDKLEYHEENLGPVEPAHWEELGVQEEQVAELTNTHGIEPVPTVKNGMVALGQHERYQAYRWDSDAVHASTTGLGHLVAGDGDMGYVGGPGDPGQVLARLVMAWHTVGDLYELVAHALGFEMPKWAEKRQAAHDELLALFAEV